MKYEQSRESSGEAGVEQRQEAAQTRPKVSDKAKQTGRNQKSLDKTDWVAESTLAVCWS